MNIHVYAKLNEELSVFDVVINAIKGENDEIYITTESRRSFRSLENIKAIGNSTIYVINTLSSLGLNDADIATELSWFIGNSVRLVVCEIPSTYEFGVTQPMNQAILSTVLQSLLSGNTNIVTVSFKRSNSGRAKLPFPNDWEELYDKWTKSEISSKEFIEMSGLKKATFYNLLTEYRDMQNMNAQYLKKYKIV